MTSVAEGQRLTPAGAATGWLLALLLTLSACAPQEEPSLRLSGTTMGTFWSAVVVDPPDEYDPAALQALLEERLRQINQSMSTYIEDSELNQLNRAPVGEWFAVGEDLFEVLLLATEVSWLTNGAFDATVGPLVRLWGFGPGAGDDRVPAAADIEAAVARVDFRGIELDLFESRARRLQPVELDLSGVAKGYGADALCTLLAQLGVRDYMVDIGGDLCLAGDSPRGTPWRIAIESPAPDGERVHLALELSDVGIVTSGDYRNFFKIDGERYSHTIDPESGWPVTHDLASVTVIAENAAYADALATAIMVKGAERGLRLAEQQGLPVYLIRRGDSAGEFEVQYSQAFAAYLPAAAGEVTPGGPTP